jgi:protein gp37
MGDLFHESVPDELIDKVFAVMALCPQHTFQCLSKRLDRMCQYLANKMLPGRIDWAVCEILKGSIGNKIGMYKMLCQHHLPDGVEGWPLPNVWLGVSVEDQAAADERIPLLLQTPAAVRFVSAEPLLGPIKLTRHHAWCPTHDFAGGFCTGDCPDRRYPDWVIAGCESINGKIGRATEIEWIRSLRDQCVSASVPFHLKQMDVNGKLTKAPALDNTVWLEFPEVKA